MRVFLVTFDCLPRRWLGCYGGHDLPTPGFDAFSSYGTTYDLAFASDVSRSPAHPGGLKLESEAGLTMNGLADPVAVRVVGGDELRGRRGRAKNSGSRLVKSLDDGIAFLEENSSRPALAWLRHPGLSVASRPRMTTSEVESVAEQLVEIDCSMGVFFERWRETAEDDWRLIVMGMEGLVQPQEDADQAVEPKLCDDWIHVPLWAVTGEGELFGRRDPRLTSTSSIVPALQRWFRGSGCHVEESDQGLETGERDAILIRGREQRALRTGGWFYRESDLSDEGSLFRKPEDAWDVCDLADRRPEICEDLSARLTADS